MKFKLNLLITGILLVFTFTSCDKVELITLKNDHSMEFDLVFKNDSLAEGSFVSNKISLNDFPVLKDKKDKIKELEIEKIVYFFKKHVGSDEVTVEGAMTISEDNLTKEIPALKVAEASSEGTVFNFPFSVEELKKVADGLLKGEERTVSASLKGTNPPASSTLVMKVYLKAEVETIK
jgi:hypothetical protein